MDEDQATETQAPAAPETKAPEAPAPAPKAEAKPDGELEKLRAELAEMRAAAKEREQADMTEAQRVESELAEKRAELAATQRELAFTKAGLPDGLAALVSIPEGSTPAKVAEQLKKMLGATLAPATGSPINPSAQPGPTKKHQKTEREEDEARYRSSRRWGRNQERTGT